MKLKTLSFIAVLSLLFISCNKPTNNPETPETPFEKAVLDIVVDYEKQPGPGSNQWAVWIEDEAGAIVNTLFVTSFTADGGYIPRPACTPIWVGKANPESMTEELISAISGATPQTGVQTYTWDLTDYEGNAVGKGTYTCYVEATLLGESEVIFKAAIEVGDKEVSVTPEPEYTTDEEANRAMIKSVTFNYRFIK